MTSHKNNISTNNNNNSRRAKKKKKKKEPTNANQTEKMKMDRENIAFLSFLFLVCIQIVFLLQQMKYPSFCVRSAF